ncbi:MAG: hypothetical protein KAX49_04845 [Halanaerobiales bacterium]|nr:hypothetical protein [Halanaerobiales bacterium]
MKGTKLIKNIYWFIQRSYGEIFICKDYSFLFNGFGSNLLLNAIKGLVNRGIKVQLVTSIYWNLT